MTVKQKQEISIIASSDTSNPFVGETKGESVFNSALELSKIILKNHWAPGIFNKVDYIDKQAIMRNGRHRTKANCKVTYVIGLDVDGGVELERALLLFADYKHVISTSRSHQQLKNGVIADRFRVILFPSEPILNDADFKATWFTISKEFPFIDPACKDISRFYYASKETISINEGGKLVTVKKATSTTAPLAKTGKDTATVKGKLSSTTLEYLVHAAPSGHRHAAMIKALIDLKEQHYSEDEARELCRRTYENNGLIFGPQQENRVTDIYQNTESKYEARWPKVYKDRSGNYRPDKNALSNYAYLINTILGYSPRYNEFTQTAEIVPENKNFDIHLAKIANAARENGLFGSKEVLLDAFRELAERNPYHPIKQVIDAALQAGDYEGSIDALIDTITFNPPNGLDIPGGREPSDIYRGYIRKWLIGAIAKLYHPGSQNLLLVFQGPQGEGKSRWLTKFNICPGVYAEGAIDPSNKDHLNYHLTKFIFHIPEVDSITTKREETALKNFLTQDFISIRRAYDRGETRGQSVASFCASVNPQSFLVDASGNRRFLVIPISAIDANHNIDIPKVLAEALAALKSGERYWLDKGEIALNEELLEPFLMASPVDAAMQRLHPGKDFLTLNEVCDHLGLPPTFGDLARLGRALTKKKIPKVRKKWSDGTRSWGYLIDKTRLF